MLTPSAPLDRKHAPRSATRPLDILVVDDEKSSRDGLALTLRFVGHTCRVASGGEEALRAMDARRPDVVISDWNMPGMNGAELCRRMRATSDNAGYTYFILLTALDDQLRTGMAAGADDYQRKPVDLEELEGRLISAARLVELHARLAGHAPAPPESSPRPASASYTKALPRVRLELTTLVSRAQHDDQRCSLAVCEIEHFEALDAHQGELAADDALRTVIDGMRRHLRPSDALIPAGRQEIVVMLIGRGLADAERAMDDVRREVERLAIASFPSGAPLTLSIGVTEIDGAAQRLTAADWLALAEAARAAARCRGSNRVVATQVANVA